MKAHSASSETRSHDNTYGDNPAGGLCFEWPIRRMYASGGYEDQNDLIVSERRIELIVNGTPFLALLALPTHIEELTLGLLISEGIWHARNDLPSVDFDGASGIVRCEGRFDSDALESFAHRRTFDAGRSAAHDSFPLSRCHPIVSLVTAPAARLVELGRSFVERCELFRATGAVHACAVSRGSSIDLFAEDIGRHNAFDKVAGMAIRQGIDLAAAVVLTTCRVSAEIAGKAIVHGVPILASLSAPSALALDQARRFDLTVVGFLRDGRMNVYTAYQRILTENE